MYATLLLAACVVGQSGVAPPPLDQRPLPAPQLYPDAKSKYPEIEDVVGRPEFDPRKRAKDNPVMVHTHVLFYWSGGEKRIMKVKWINTEARPNTMVAVPHIDFYPMNRLATPVIVLVEGQLHYGRAHTGQPKLRWKIKEWRGRKYKEQRHWRTDRAVYILNPTVKAIKAGVDWQAEKKAWIENLRSEEEISAAGS